MRLRNSTAVLKRLQRRLRITGHTAEDSYSRAMLTRFWDRLRYDKRIVKGEI